MKEKILALNSIKEIWFFDEIKQKLATSDEILQENLMHLSEENSLVITVNKEIYFIGKNYFSGELRINDRGFGFVKNSLNDEESFFVPPTSLKECITTDLVVYKKIKEKDEQYRAEICDLVERTQKSLVGTIVKSKDGRFLDFIPSQAGFMNYRIAMVNKNDFNLQADLLVKVKILNVRERKLFVSIIKIIGNANKAYDRILAIAQEFNILTEFKFKTTQEAKIVAQKIDFNQDEVKRRLKDDLRKRIFVTIDGDDAKDLDDAICIEKTPSGYKLIVAIADVSYYVRPLSFLDKEALIRGNSTYLANIVLPMLPEQLSNGVCSLNPNEDKLVMVCEIDLDDDGNLLTKRAYESIIKSSARLTYNNVNKFLAGNSEAIPDHVHETLNNAFALHKKIEILKQKKGTIDFEISEPKIILDKDFNVIDIKTRERAIAERLIENFMVTANECVASIIFEKNLPFVYRDHGNPDPDKLNDWYKTITNAGYDLKLNSLEKTNPKTIVGALNKLATLVNDKTELEVLDVALLRAMDKARYDSENIGHFGLASNCYTHFTSPIRRYADLMVHRFLKSYLIDNKKDELSLQNNQKFIDKATKIINETEKVSVSCEREVNKICMAEYLQSHLGEEHQGIISAVLKFGLFIQLPNMIEGLVHISIIPNNPVYDEKMKTIILDNNKQFKLGQKIKIKIKDASVKKRMIDFELV